MQQVKLVQLVAGTVAKDLEEQLNALYREGWCVTYTLPGGVARVAEMSLQDPPMLLLQRTVHPDCKHVYGFDQGGESVDLGTARHYWHNDMEDRVYRYCSSCGDWLVGDLMVAEEED